MRWKHSSVLAGDYDAKFDDTLSYDRGLALPVRPTHTSYNKPDNWRERNEIGLTNVKEQLQDLVDSSVSPKKRFVLELEHNNYHDRDEEPIVWHDNILDEYWDKLEAKFGRSKQLLEEVTDICDIHIENIEMKKERMSSLVTALCGQVDENERIDFINVNLCEEGIVSVSKLVDCSYQLQSLTMNYNRIETMESARCLSRSLKSHARINHLYLSHCDLGSSPDILLVILQSDVWLIDLSRNNIDSLGAIKIAEYLEGNPPIEHLFLEKNLLNDDDTQLISQALKRNTNLKTLSLHTNNITSIGVKTILTCFFDISSLNAISESNHTLERMIFFTDTHSFKDVQNCIDNMCGSNKTQKILLALQDKESLLKYLANIPVELMPEVLALSLRQDDDQLQHRHLNVVYSIMRWWNMPMLFPHHCSNIMMSDTK